MIRLVTLVGFLVLGILEAIGILFLGTLRFVADPVKNRSILEALTLRDISARKDAETFCRRFREAGLILQNRNPISMARMRAMEEVAPDLLARMRCG